MSEEKELKCPHCGSADVSATGSEQQREDNKRYADLVCNSCGKSFWSHEPTAIAASRRIDRERRDVRD